MRFFNTQNVVIRSYLLFRNSRSLERYFISNPIGVFCVSFVKPTRAFVGCVGVPADGAAPLRVRNFTQMFHDIVGTPAASLRFSDEQIIKVQDLRCTQRTWLQAIMHKPHNHVMNVNN